MKKTINSILLISFSLLSLHIHVHADDHSHEPNHSSEHNEQEKICYSCDFNSDKTLEALATNSNDIYFENIFFNQYNFIYRSSNLFFLNNKSPPKA